MGLQITKETSETLLHYSSQHHFSPFSVFFIKQVLSFKKFSSEQLLQPESWDVPIPFFLPDANSDTQTCAAADTEHWSNTST